MTHGKAASALSGLLVFCLVAWVVLGGLDESGKWPVPDGVLTSLDTLVKASAGSLITLLTQNIRGHTG